MSRVILPVDRLDTLWPSPDPQRRLGALLHGASTTSTLQPTLETLQRLQGKGYFRLSAIFGPQHGFLSTTQDNMVEWNGFQHPVLGIPVFSLYGEHREPTPEMLDGIDVLFVDLVDVGARYYTFIWTLFLCMRACSQAGVPVIVANRPNPLNGVDTEGEPQDPDYLSFVGLHPLPHRHGKTIGELAQQFQEEVFPDCDLTVLPMEGWDRSQWFDETGLPWVMPSPNMPTLDTATVYPGMCLLEGTNLSEGRGTTRPFELFGAPWIDGEDLARRLQSLRLPGVHFRPIAFEPTFQKHARQVCHGCQIHVLDRKIFRSYEMALALLRLIHELYPNEFTWNPPPYEYETEKLPIEILLGRSLRLVFDQAETRNLKL